VPRDLETIVLMAMEKDRANRFATSADMAADLLRFAEGEAVLARRSSPIARLGRAVRRNWVRTGLVALAVGLAALAGGTIARNRHEGGRIDAAAPASRGRDALERKEASEAERVRGTRLRRQGDPEGAIAAFRRAIELDSLNDAAHLELALLLNSLRRFDEALEVCERLLEFSESSHVHHHRAGALRGLGERAEALKTAARGLELYPAHAGLQRRRVINLMETGRFDEAIETCRESYRFYGTSPLLHRFEVACHLALGREREARQLAERYRREGVGGGKPPIRGYLLAVLGEGEEAEEALGKGRRGNPLICAAAYGILRDRDGLVECLDLALELGEGFGGRSALETEFREFADDPEVRGRLERIPIAVD